MKDELRKQEKRLRGEFRDEIKHAIDAFTALRDETKNKDRRHAYEICISCLKSLLHMNYSRLSSKDVNF